MGIYSCNRIYSVPYITSTEYNCQVLDKPELIAASGGGGILTGTKAGNQLHIRRSIALISCQTQYSSHGIDVFCLAKRDKCREKYHVQRLLLIAPDVVTKHCHSVELASLRLLFNTHILEMLRH
jgi:hypothetical protein